MKIYLQTEIVNEFEFDALESFCTLPMIIEKKMIITNFLGLIYLTENTLRKVSNELKKLLDKEKTKSFRLKKATLTITELTAYSVRVGKKNENGIYLEKIFDNFNKSERIFSISTSCDFPYENMEIYFQTKGDVYLEFELEDIFFSKDNYNLFYELQMIKLEEIKNSNKKIYSNFLENLYKNQLKI